MNTSRRLLISGVYVILLIVVVVPLSCRLLFEMALFELSYFRDKAPNSYNRVVSEVLGIGCYLEYDLSPMDAARVAASGQNPSTVANAIAATKWAQRTYEANIDSGILLKIYHDESGSGRNMGSYDGIERAKKNKNLKPEVEEDAAKWLLAYWKQHGVKNEYIYPDYSGYLGGFSAGEIGGGQFIPSMAFHHCNNALSKSGDIKLHACDFWDEKTTMHAIAHHLYMIGYRAHQSDQKKIEKLYGWNHNQDYRKRLVAGAKRINEAIGRTDVMSYQPMASLQMGISLQEDARVVVINFLDLVNLLPEGSTWLEAPLAPNDITGITQDWREDLGNGLWHPGIDYGCLTGATIMAVGPGQVVKTSSQGGFGKHVWIQHASNLFTVYGHLSDISVREGQRVDQGQKIGECGSTGKSTGSHCHFGVYKKGPGEYHYRVDALNPYKYLGQCGPPPDTG